MLKLKRDDLGGPRRAAHRLQELLYDYIDFCTFIGDGEEDEAADAAEHFMYLAGWDDAEVDTEESGWDARVLRTMGGEIVGAACSLDAKSDFVEQEENRDMQRYNTTRTVYAMQWRPDDPKARKAFLDELQELSDGVRELHEEHGWYESEDIIRTEIQETDECIMWACRAFGACCRKRAGRLQITYDHTDEIVLDPGMWLIYEWPRKYWLYAVSDDRFRAEYTLCTD